MKHATHSLTILAAAFSLNACVVTPIYSGPQRHARDLSIIEPKAVSVTAVNGKDIRYGSKFSMLPGVYEMALLLDDGNRLIERRRYTTRVLRVCVNVKPGRTYLLRPVYSEDLWRPELIDEQTTYRAGIRILDSALDGCDRPPAATLAAASPTETAPAAPHPSAAPGPSPVPGEPVATVAPGTQEAPAAAPGTPAAGPTAAAEPAAPDQAPAASTPAMPPMPPRIAADTEAPPAPRSRRLPRVAQASADPPSRAQPRTHGAFSLELGFGLGGADLAQVTLSNGEEQTLSAGDGLLFALALQFTPIWLGGGQVGLGFGGSAGIKYFSIGASNGHISLNRFPLVGSVHAIVPTSDDGYLLFRTGLVKEVGVNLSGDGLAEGLDVPLQSGLGLLVDGGYGAAMAPNVEWTLVFRYTHLSYSAGGESIPARSFGLVGGIQFTF